MKKIASPLTTTDPEMVDLINLVQERAYLPGFLPLQKLELTIGIGEVPRLLVEMNLPNSPKATWQDVIRLAKLVPNPTWADVVKFAAELNLPEAEEPE